MKSFRTVDGNARLTIESRHLAHADEVTVRFWKETEGFRKATRETGNYAELEATVLKPSTAGAAKQAAGALKLAASFQIEDQLSAEKHFGRIFARAFHCIKVSIVNNGSNPVLIHSAAIELPISYVGRARNVGDQSLGGLSDEWDPQTVLFELDDHTYYVWDSMRTPMNFTAVLNALDFDQRHDGRNVFVSIMRGIGAIAGGATGFDGLGRTYPKVVGLFNGPINETLAKLLLADLVKHVEFMNESALHETVTVPGRSSVQKYVFFPKGDILGVWGFDLPVRVMTVSELRGDEAVIQGIELVKTRPVQGSVKSQEGGPSTQAGP